MIIFNIAPTGNQKCYDDFAFGYDDKLVCSSACIILWVLVYIIYLIPLFEDEQGYRVSSTFVSAVAMHIALLWRHACLTGDSRPEIMHHAETGWREQGFNGPSS